MRKARVIENCRCYHLISRLAHRAFFLDDEEKTQAVELMRRCWGRGSYAFVMSCAICPLFLSGGAGEAAKCAAFEPYFRLAIPPVMDVTTALAVASRRPATGNGKERE